MTLSKITPWVSRFVLFAATFVFFGIAIKFIGNPVTAAAASGISLPTQLSKTDMRVGFGAFPLALALVYLACLASPRRAATGLAVLASVAGVTFVVRLVGAISDGTMEQSMFLLRAEGSMLVFSSIALFLEQARSRSMSNTPATAHR